MQTTGGKCKLRPDITNELPVPEGTAIATQRSQSDECTDVYAQFFKLLSRDTSLTGKLDGEGMAIFDGVLGKTRCAALRDEIDMLYATDKLLDSPNKLSAISSDDASKDEVVIINKPGVRELTIVTTNENNQEPPHIDSALASTPVLSALYTHIDVLIKALNEAAPFLELTSLYHLKVARLCSCGQDDDQGANDSSDGKPKPRKPPAFAAHFDTQPGTGRTLSLCVWLNEGWTPAQGGHLRVFPAPLLHVDVEPLCDRAAIFCSHHMLHRVRPLQFVKGTTAPRYCVSMMFRGSATPFPSALPVELANKLSAIDTDVHAMLCLARRQQRDIVMLVFREESVASMREAFSDEALGDKETVERAVAHFERRLNIARQHIAPAMLQLIDNFLPLNPADILGA